MDNIITTVVKIGAWFVDSWALWGIMFAAAGALKLLGRLINSGPNIFG